MIYAKSETGEKIQASRGKKATCLHCDEKVIARCGEVNTWHWSHEKNSDCSFLNKGMTYWHINWQEQFPLENREVMVFKNGKGKIADVKLDNGLVIEFQHSSIKIEEIWEREKIYDNMIWILDYSDKDYTLHEKNGKYYMDLYGFRKNFCYANKPFYINFFGFFLYCPKTLMIYEVKDGKMKPYKHDYDIDRVLIKNCFSPYADYLHNVIAFEQKIAKVKRMIKDKNSDLSVFQDLRVFDWFLKYVKKQQKEDTCNKINQIRAKKFLT